MMELIDEIDAKRRETLMPGATGLLGRKCCYRASEQIASDAANTQIFAEP